MLDRETKSKLEKFIDKINEEDVSVYAEISEAILKIIEREYSIKLARVLHDR